MEYTKIFNKNLSNKIIKLSQRYFSYSVDYKNPFFGTPFENNYHIKCDESLKIRLLKIDEQQEEIKILKKQKNGNLQKIVQDKLRYEWTYNSNALEGNQLTLGDTIFFLKEGITVGGKKFKDFVETKNHNQAIKYMMDIIKRKEDCEITASLIKDLNGMILSGIEHIEVFDEHKNPRQDPLQPGIYKKELNYVIQNDGTIHEYVEPYDVPAQVDDMCQWCQEREIQQDLHPILTASILHYNFVRIHPFQDGNGRTARLLMNLHLMRNNYYPTIIKVEDRQNYLNFLKMADKDSLLPFANFVIKSIEETQDVILSVYKTHDNKPKIKNIDESSKKVDDKDEELSTIKPN